MNLSISTTLHFESVPIDVTGDSVNSSPRCAPCNGMIQPSSCMLPGPPSASTTNAWVLAFVWGACTTCCAICWQYGHWSQLLSSCCSHCEQNFLAKIQNPRVITGGFGFGPCGAPGIPGIPGIPCGDRKS